MLLVKTLKVLRIHLGNIQHNEIRLHGHKSVEQFQNAQFIQHNEPFTVSLSVYLETISYLKMCS